MVQQRVRERLVDLYGIDELPRDAGVVHVAAVWAGDRDGPVVLKIGPQTPKSPQDAFALSLARARADVVLTTGAILRAEPAMTLDPLVDAAALSAWRQDTMGRPRPPAALVLTLGGDVPLAHPVLAAAGTRILTGAEGATRLAGIKTPVVRLDEPSAASAIAWAAAHLGATTIAVEAGPTAAMPLYDPLRVDELMLSVLQTEPPAAVRGGRFIGSAQRERAGLRCISDVAAGDWRIQRWLRAR